jgi:phosphotransferase system HPr-like phosphotransfer protein
MDAAMHKMEIVRLIGMDEGEEIKLECIEVVDEEEALKRLNNVRKYKQQPNNDD